MAVLKYDVSDVETGGGGADVPVGLRRGNIVGITLRGVKKSGNTPISDLEVVVDFGAGYQRKYYYVKLPDDPNWDKTLHGWKLREFTDAVALPAKGGIDTTANGLKKLYKAVNARISPDTDQDGNPRNRIKNLFLPVDEGVEELEEVTSDSGEEGTSTSGADEGPYGRAEMETWTNEDLAGYAAELGVEVPTGRGAKNKLLDALVIAEAEADGGAEAGGDGGEGGNAALLEGLSEEILNDLKDDPEHYSEWSDDEVKEFAVELGIDGNIPTSGRGWRGKAIQGIVDFATQAVGSDNGAAAAGEPEPEGDDYDDEGAWPTDDLKAEIDDRNAQGAGITIAGRATRQKLIDALRADNAVAEPF